MLHYAHVDVAIASWWGPDSHLDRSRITNLLNKSRGKSLFWTIYHEIERDFNPSVQEIQADLAYLKKWFAWHENWAHIDGLPVLFLYNEDDCNVSERWMTAAQGEWFVVLKLFRDYENCAVQPSQWHQYGPAGAVAHQPGYSFSISPGFWRADLAEPQLARVSKGLLFQRGEHGK
ncbi:sigma-70 [Fragilaria crotonensis]|nr:sigma-70 [Fragilaria crotonensis]